MKTLKLAVVGAGHLGRIHAKLLAEMPEVQLIGIADPLPAARDRVAADCRTTAYAHHSAFIGRVDAAVVATPTRHHLAVALDLLKHKVPLLVEKPLTASLDEAEQLVAAAEAHRTTVQVGHIERFNPAYLAAAAHVRQPRYIEAVRAAGFTGRSTDVGVVYDLMIHDIDLVLSLADSPLRSVAAIGLAVLGQHEDVAQARLEFANGCVANLSASRVSFAAAPRRQMQIWSAEGYATVDFATRSASVVHPSEDVVARRMDFESLSSEQKVRLKERLFSEVLRVEPLVVEARNALADELRDFVDSVRRARAPRVTAQQGREAIAVAEAILQSIKSHAWQGQEAAAVGPLAMPAPGVLRGPHWHATQAAPPQPLPTRRDAG